MENKEKYSKRSLQDADRKPDSQMRTHLAPCNKAERGDKVSKSARNHGAKGTKLQEVFQGREWTAKWQMSFRRGKCRELHSEKITQTRLIGDCFEQGV